MNINICHHYVNVCLASLCILYSYVFDNYLLIAWSPDVNVVILVTLCFIQGKFDEMKIGDRDNLFDSSKFSFY